MDNFGFEVCIREIKHYGKVDGNAILEAFGGIIVDCFLSWNFMNKFYKVLFNQVIFKYFFLLFLSISLLKWLDMMKVKIRYIWWFL